MARHDFGALILVFCSVLFSSLSPAQTHALPPPVGGITFDQVVRLSQSGLSDVVIIAQIKKRSQPFDLTPEQLLVLKNARVSDGVIEAMVGASDPPASPSKSGVIAPLTAVAPDTDIPSEIGVYAKLHGEWTELDPEVVNWKTGGVVKSHVTLGVVKGDINGHINHSSSPNKVTVPMDILIVAPEGDAISEYQLLRLHHNSDGREFRTVTGGVFHASGGATRDLLPFDSKKVVTRTYLVKLPIGFGSGEYGFLPPGAYASTNLASTGKIYSFRVVE